MQTITIWSAYTTRTKNGSGFAELGPFSAHFGEAEIFICELEPDDAEVASESLGEKITHAICIPTQLTGSAYESCGKRLYCKSAGHAEHIMRSRKPLERAKALGWYATPQAAAKAAYEQLRKRALRGRKEG